MRTHTRKVASLEIVTYSVDSALDLMEETMPSESQHRWDMKYRQVRNADWFELGLHTGDHVVKAVAELDDKLTEGTMSKLRLISAPLSKKAVARETRRRRRRRRGDIGNEVDIHAVRQGRSDVAWSRTETEYRETQGSKSVTLLVNCGMNANISPSQVHWRSAALIATHDALVQMGKSVAIAFDWPSRKPFVGERGNRLYHFYALLKNYDRMMSPRHLAAYSSAAFIRLFMLSRFYNLPGKCVSSGYGSTARLEEQLLPWPAHQMRERGHHVVLLGACYSQDAAERTIEQVVEQVRDPSHVTGGDRERLI